MASVGREGLLFRPKGSFMETWEAQRICMNFCFGLGPVMGPGDPEAGPAGSIGR